MFSSDAYITLMLQGVPSQEGVKQEWGGENKLFSSKMRQYLENVWEIRTKLLKMTNRKLHTFNGHLPARSVTLDDLELLLVRIFGVFCRFGRQPLLNE